MGARRKRSTKPSGTKAERLLESTTFFVDVCLGRQVGEALREDGWAIVFHVEHFEPDARDEEWLPIVGENGWVVLTKDKNIRRKPAELAKVVAARVRLFTLPGGSMSGAEMIDRFRASKARIARFLNNNTAPFVAFVQADEIVSVPLEK